MMAFLKLIRYKNLLMVALTLFLTKYAFINSYLSKPYLSDLEFIILSLSILLITAGGYIINDIYDIDVDQINKPKKALIGIIISKKKAWFFYIIFTIVGIILGSYLSYKKHLFDHTFYFLGTALGLILYSIYFKRFIFFGNLLVAFFCALIIYLIYSFDIRLHGETDISSFFIENINITSIGTLLAIIKTSKLYFLRVCFGTTLIREMIKDIEDIDGDYNKGYKTLPILFGRKRTRNIVIILSIALFIYITLFAWVFYTLDAMPLAIITWMVLIALLYFIYKLRDARTKKEFHFLSNLMKLIMLLGILSMGLFKFI